MKRRVVEIRPGQLLPPHPVIGLVADGRGRCRQRDLDRDEDRDGDLCEAHRACGHARCEGHSVSRVLGLPVALVMAAMRSMKARNSAETTKVRWMKVNHISLSLLYCSTLRNT